MMVLFRTMMIISTLFGIWHFFIPDMFRWFSYIPDAPNAIVASVIWINFFFSLLLTGISAMLLVFWRRVFERDRFALSLYALLIFTWLSRVVITLLVPWNRPFQLMDILQVSVFTLVFVLMVLPFFAIFSSKSR